MSKSKIPTLPPNASRSALIAFRDQVRTYARKDFEKGATPDAVYAQVAPNGQLWALKSSIDAEYLDFLGIPRRKARATGVVVAMGVFFVLSGFSPSSNTLLHFVLPVLIALCLARFAELQATAMLRSAKEKELRATDP